MQTVSLNIYQFSELSDTAKQRAKDDYAALFGYAWADDALESLSALAKHFGGKLKDYSVDFFNCSHSSASFDMPEMEESEIADRLESLGSFNPETLRGNGDCGLTGYCADDDAIDGFRMAWHGGERDLDRLMRAAFKTWLKAAQDDCEDQYSDEQFSEHCDANKYRFTEDGEFYRE